MTEKLKYKLFTSTDCIPERTMLDYIDDRLSAKDQHLVEKHLLDCDLCSDALEGLQMLKNRGRIKTINRIISQRISGSEKKIIGINSRIIISVAAGLLLLLGGVFFFNQFTSKEMMDSGVAENQSPQKKAPADEAPVTTDSTIPPVSNTAGSTVSTIVTKENTISSGKDKEGKLEESKETQKSFQQEIAKTESPAPISLIDRETMADELKQSEVSAKISPNEDFRTTTVTQTTTFALEKNAERIIVAEDKKNAPAGVNRQDDNSGYYAKEQTETKKAEKKKQVSRNENKTSLFKEKEESKPLTSAKSPAYTTTTGEVEMNNKMSDLSKKDANKDALSTIDNTISLDSTYGGLAENDGTFAIVDEMPEFPGGTAELKKYIKNNFKYPAAKTEAGAGDSESDDQRKNTRIIVQFIIGEKGDIKNVKILKGIDPELDKEAIRIIKAMPQWKPGKLKGKNVDSKYVLPVEVEFK